MYILLSNVMPYVIKPVDSIGKEEIYLAVYEFSVGSYPIIGS